MSVALTSALEWAKFGDVAAARRRRVRGSAPGVNEMHADSLRASDS